MSVSNRVFSLASEPPVDKTSDRSGTSDLPPDFDELGYLADNQDVARAVSAGEFQSGAHHWLTNGRHENRPLRSHDSMNGADTPAAGTPETSDVPELPPDFDEAAYLAANGDVAQAVRTGESISGADHWRRYGRYEDRPLRVIDPDPPDAEPPEQEEAVEEAADAAPADPLEMPAASRCRSSGSMIEQAAQFDAVAYAANNPDVVGELGVDPDGLYQHWRTHGVFEGRAVYGLAPYRDRSFGPGLWRKRDGITFFGLLDSPIGLGTSARGYVEAIRRAGFDVEAVTVESRLARLEISPPDAADPADRAARRRRRQDGRINIFHFNADTTHRFFVDRRESLLDDSYNIAIWFWELALFRSDWATAFGAYDEIWVSSEFVREAISAVSPIPVVKIPMAVPGPSGEPPLPRSHFRLPDGAFLFGCIFDVGSTVSRKNPAAAIAAFLDRFAGRDDVILVLKYHSAHHDPAAVKEIKALAAGHANIRFFGRVFSERENESLKAALDCLVSPHRSEGFGLNLAEAMALAIPVIATGYSGNMEFMSADTSYLVDYELRELPRDCGPYPRGALWAEPDVRHLADLMGEVVEDREGAAAKARRARDHILTAHDTAAVADAIGRRIGELGIIGSAVPPFLQNWGAGIGAVTPFLGPEGPVISVVVPVYDIEAGLLERCVQSVSRQSYRRWELILYDDGSTRQDTIDVLHRLRGSDPRIRVAFGRTNRGISAATNAAIALSSGEFLAFLDNDDELSPDALAEVAAAIAETPSVDVLYSDEDKLDAKGRHCDHYFKPDWSPEHLESVMYLLHLMVIRRSVVLEVGGLREAFSGAQDYDLALRATRVARHVVHIPKVLYHWRKVEGSAAAAIDAKPIGLQRAAEALQDHLEAQGRDAKAVPGLAQGLNRAQDAVAPGVPVTLVIFTDNRRADVPGRGDINLLDHVLDSIATTTRTRADLRYLVVDNGNLDEEQHRRVAALNGRVVSYRGSVTPFNFSDKANFAFSHVETDLVIMLNDDMEVITPEWVDAMVGLAQRPEIGVVGARLLFADGRIQHCGVVLGVNDSAVHICHGWSADQVGYNGYTHLVRNYLAVTGACAAFRMSVLAEVGGFDRAFAIDFNDIDFCLRVYEAGYRNVYTPFASLYHFEGLTVTRRAPSKAEHKIFARRWRRYIDNDPFYNPNLRRDRVDYSPVPELGY